MVGFIGRFLAGAADAGVNAADQQLKANLMAERDKRLQEFQSSERQAGQQFTAEQNALNRQTTVDEAEKGRTLQRELHTQTDTRIREEGAATRGIQKELAMLTDQRMREEARLTREQQSRLAGASMAQARMLAEANRPMQQDNQGNYFVRKLDGQIEYLTDPSTGERMRGAKDLGGAAKIMAETIQAQIKEVEKAPPEVMTPEQKQKRMGELYRDLTAVLTGKMPDVGVAGGNGAMPENFTGWDSKTGDVIWMGGVIKRGATREEAQRLLAKASKEAKGPAGTGSPNVSQQQSRSDLYKQIGTLTGPQGLGNPNLDEASRGVIQRRLDEISKQYANTPQ